MKKSEKNQPDQKKPAKEPYDEAVQSSDNREKILTTALTLFTERGFFGTPTSLISKEAGVATGTLFFYFPTKPNQKSTTISNFLHFHFLHFHFLQRSLYGKFPRGSEQSLTKITTPNILSPTK